MKSYKNIPSKAKGFTLIEFLVASALAVIVIMAAGSTYFFTRRLNDNAQNTIDRQNALRNAATAISRDARVAGSFGCFVTGGAIGTTGSAAQTAQANDGNFPTFSAGSTQVAFDNSNVSGYGVAVLPHDDLETMLRASSAATVPAGLALTGNALVLVYGKGSAGVSVPPARRTFGALTGINSTGGDLDVRETIDNSGQLVLSSCNDAYSLTPATGSTETNITFGSLNTKFIEDKIGELTLSRMYAAAYVRGTINGVESLLRYETQADGTWGEPQLLVSNISAMDFSFAYTDNCDMTADTPAQNVQFSYSDTLNHRNLPALIQIRLTYQNGLPPYVINANVRGGNACANIGASFS